MYILNSSARFSSLWTICDCHALPLCQSSEEHVEDLVDVTREKDNSEIICLILCNKQLLEFRQVFRPQMTYAWGKGPLLLTTPPPDQSIIRYRF
jgi:hypothetical protein